MDRAILTALQNTDGIAKDLTSVARATDEKGKSIMSLTDNIFGIHGTALALRSQRLNMLASNIANAGTPGYKARDLDFDKAMQMTSEGQSLHKVMSNASGYRTPLQPSSDGNTVELSTEQTLFAENAMHYRTTLSFLESRVKGITRALKGE